MATGKDLKIQEKEDDFDLTDFQVVLGENWEQVLDKADEKPEVLKENAKENSEDQDDADEDKLLAEFIEVGNKIAAVPTVPSSSIFLAKISELKDPDIVHSKSDKATGKCSFFKYAANINFDIVYVGILGVVELILKDEEKQDIWWLSIKETDSEKSIACRLQMLQHINDGILSEYENRLAEYSNRQRKFQKSKVMPEDYDEKCLMFFLQRTRRVLNDNKMSFCKTRDDLIPFCENHFREGCKVFVTGKLAYYKYSRMIFINSIKILDDDDIGKKEENIIWGMIVNREI